MRALARGSRNQGSSVIQVMKEFLREIAEARGERGGSHDWQYQRRALKREKKDDLDAHSKILSSLTLCNPKAETGIRFCVETITAASGMMHDGVCLVGGRHSS